MKKLMIAAVIVCAAVCAQAATVTWNTNNRITIDGAYAPSGLLLYAFDPYVTARDTVIAALQSDDAVTAFNALTYANSKITSSQGAAVGSFSQGRDASNKNYVYLVLFNGGEVANGVQAYVTDIYASSPYDPGVIRFDPIEIDGWTATLGAVPEPTSGLLTLLGMAGLALRRKRM